MRDTSDTMRRIERVVDMRSPNRQDRAMRAFVLFLASCAGPTAIHPDISKLDDPAMWLVANADSHASSDAGKRQVRLAPIGGNRKGSNVGLALVAGLSFAEGAIDVDLRGRGDADPSFVGIAFGVADPARYEAVYFRPFRFRSADAVERSHAVQYIAWPDHTWEALRSRSPGIYEAAIAPVPDPGGWFHARIEIDRTTVKVFVDGAAKPTLVVDRLRTAAGGVGLWVDSQAGSFANLEIRPAA
jgi:hypothetical protein